MSDKIEIIEAGTQIGVKSGNQTNFYARVNVETFSNNDGLVGLKDLITDQNIVLSHPSNYLYPKESSVKDLIVAIKTIIETIPVYELTKDELEAIQGANNPSSSNVFATVADSITPTEKAKLSGIETGATANSTDAVLLDRTNHTGTQIAATISDFASATLAVLMVGYTVGANVAIAATDSVFEAFRKAQAQIDAKEDLANKGIANGYGSLDANIKQPISERPFPFFTSIETARIRTPSTLTATASDYAPTDWLIADLFRQDVDINNRIISGLQAPPAGENRIVGLNNINASGLDIRFAHESGGSLAVNRLLMRDGAQKSLKPNETAWFWYDHTSLRWRPFNRIG